MCAELVLTCFIVFSMLCFNLCLICPIGVVLCLNYLVCLFCFVLFGVFVLRFVNCCLMVFYVLKLFPVIAMRICCLTLGVELSFCLCSCTVMNCVLHCLVVFYVFKYVAMCVQMFSDASALFYLMVKWSFTWFFNCGV